MKISLLNRERRSPESIAISVVAHVFIVAAIGAITFRVPLSALLGDRVPPPKAVTLTYVQVSPKVPSNAPAAAPAPQKGSPTPEKPVPEPVVAPPTIPTPTAIPIGLPPVTAGPPAGYQVGIPGGTGTAASTVVSPKTGIEPAIPDPRISLQPQPYSAPKSMAARNDSAVMSAFAQYRDSVAASLANKPRAGGDWTVDRNGQKWGWDQQGIRLGKYTIPNLIFAALPLKIGPTGNINAIQDNRAQAWRNSDTQLHAAQMSDADFRAAVKRIRDRVDRERQEAQQAKPAVVAGPIKPPGH